MTAGPTDTELVLSLYPALADWDEAALDALLDPDFVGEATPGLPLGLGGRYETAQRARREFWGVMGRHFEVVAHPAETQVLPDGRILVRGTYLGTARATGRKFEAEFVHLVTAANGRLTGLVQLTDGVRWAEALRRASCRPCSTRCDGLPPGAAGTDRPGRPDRGGRARLRRRRLAGPAARQRRRHRGTLNRMTLPQEEGPTFRKDRRPMANLVPTTPELEALRSAVRQIVDRYGFPYFLDCSIHHKEPTELYEELGAAGFLGIHLPEEYGGGGAGLTETCVVLEEIAAGGCPLLMLVIAPAICGSIIAAHGSDELKRGWLPGLADGTKTMAFAITEPDAGSNSHEISVTARRDGSNSGDYLVNGTKYWTSGPDQADAILVVCRDADSSSHSAAGTHTRLRREERKQRGTSSFDPEPIERVDRREHTPMSMLIVPAGAPGLSMTPIETELVQPEKQFTVFFDDVRVPATNLVGEAGKGFRAVFAGLNPERVTAAAMSNGISRYAMEKATRYACEREVWKVPIGSHQGISHPLAECYIAVAGARVLTARAAQMCDGGEDAAEAVNIAKFAAAEAMIRTLDQAIQVHGGNGMAREYGLAPLWFLARMLRTAPTSREMVLNFVAEHSLKLPASY